MSICRTRSTYLLKYKIILLAAFFPISVVNTWEISIATCNLWNVMFNWETRIKRIADIIREHNLDIIVFQEVRLNNGGTDGETKTALQLNEFRPYLPEYRWVLASSAGTVTKVKNSYKEEWSFEGLGILSRWQIISSNVVKLKQTTFNDRNKRIVLHVTIKLGPEEDDVVDVLVVHFSYDSGQQCQNTQEVIKVIEGSNLRKVIVLGDFNAYGSKASPMELFLSKENNVCPLFDSNIIGTFRDAWLDAGNNHSMGLTFSNMPSPGLQSRPDRILASKSIGVLNAGLIGDGHYFKQNYYTSILLSRANAIVKTSFQAFSGYQGYSCLHDCGPHGSCRCGVCVTGGDKNNCEIPNCFECSSRKFILFIGFLVPAFVFCVIFFLAVVRILVISARFSQKDIQEILGYRCCLFNRQLFQTKILPRRYRISLSNFIQLYHVPPVWVILGTFIISLLLFLVFKICFKDSIDLVYSILPEEQFPSDHKIVYAKLRV